MIEFGHGTHVGLRRARNEDTYYADPALGLFLVADGMGGHQYGEVASALARDVIVEKIQFGIELVEAVKHASSTLRDRSGNHQNVLPMGTTIAAMWFHDDIYEVAWVGDSRLYLWQNAMLTRISHDHSLVQELVQAGKLERDQASRHTQRNVLTQALGITATDQLDIGMARGRVSAGMRFLICSDGLTEEVSEPTIGKIMARNDLSAQECIDHLLLAALSAEGKDNVTAIAIRYH